MTDEVVDIATTVSVPGSGEGGPSGLRVDWDRHPLAVSARPLITWIPRGEQTGLQHDIEVTDSHDVLVWSGRTAPSARELRLSVALAPFESFVASVRGVGAVTDARVEFETGPLSAADWTAEWITAPAGFAPSRTFEIEKTDRARVYVAAQGLVRVIVNGVVINEGRLDPSRSAPTRALYRTFDVTDLLWPGSNEVSAVLGIGSWGVTGHPPRVMLQLDHWLDGRRVSVPLEAGLAPGSAVRKQTPFYIERIDETFTSEDSAVEETSIVRWGVPATVDPDVSPAVKVLESWEVTERSRHGDVRVYDVGENIAGRTRLTLLAPLPAGTVVTFVHGELLDAEGRVDTTNLTMPFDHGRPRQVFEWVTGGQEGERGEPWFAYYGFRYVELSGIPDDSRVILEARVLHSAVADTLEVQTDGPLLGALLTSARRTALNNLHSVPEDCPTREQAAWTGDMASAAEWEMLAFDHRAFLGKWLLDLADSQEADGSISGIAPDPRGAVMPSDPVWGSALPRVLLGHWLHYGDLDVVAALLPALRRWADHILSRVGSTGVIDQFSSSYGHDWLALEQTPPELLHTAAGIDCLEVLATLEEATGGSGSVQRARAAALRTAAREAFVGEHALVANGSQGAIAAAITAGFLTAPEVALNIGRAVDDIVGRGWRISTGFAATRWLVEALARHSRHDVIAAVLRQQAEPGIGAMLATGPGTLWENWWIDPRNTGTGSLDHVGLGAPFAAWVVRNVAGLAPVEGGWSRIRFAPVVLEGPTRVTATLGTVRGRLRGGWTRHGHGTIRIELEVPEGAEADVTLPDGTAEVVGGGTHAWEVQDDAIAVPEPEAGAAWHAPALARRAVDVDRGAAEVRIMPDLSNIAIEELGQLECMPIPHAQFPHAISRITSTRAGVLPAAVLEIEPTSTHDLRFAYAHVDTCLDGGGGAALPLLRVRFEDGSSAFAVGRMWPAGWNRVAVPLPAGRSIVSLEVALVANDTEVVDIAAYSADAARVGFHLGEVGFSGLQPRW